MEDINLNTIPTLKTERLLLRGLSESDAGEIFLLRSDGLINKYLDRNPCLTIEDALKFIDAVKSNNLSYWAITKQDSKKLLGTICLFDFSEDLKKCEIGYELLLDFQGKGIMREAAKKVIEYAIETIGIKTIDAHTHVANKSSIKLLTELKFERTNIVDGNNSNLILYCLKGNSEN